MFSLFSMQTWNELFENTATLFLAPTACDHVKNLQKCAPQRIGGHCQETDSCHILEYVKTLIFTNVRTKKLQQDKFKQCGKFSYNFWICVNQSHFPRAPFLLFLHNWETFIDGEG